MIQLYENKDQIFNDSIDRIIIELFNKKNKKDEADFLMLTGCSALSGTTSISIAIAIAIANTNRRVLLVDCDMRKSAQYKKLNQNINYGFADYLEGKDGDKELFKKIVKETNIKNLFYIPCGYCKTNPTRLLCSEKMKDVIEETKTNCDYVIFDVPSLSIVPDANVLFKYVDGSILVAALGETTKLQIKQAKRKLLKQNSSYYGMIVNKVDKSEFNKVVRNYDYYFNDGSGGQKLNERIKMFRKEQKEKKGE